MLERRHGHQAQLEQDPGEQPVGERPRDGSTRRRSGSNRPVQMISAPHRAKARHRCAEPAARTPVVTSSAAPGVDHAMLTGSRVRTLMSTASTPMITLAVSSPEAALLRRRRPARRPASTTVNELAKPTSAVITPAVTG